MDDLIQIIVLVDGTILISKIGQVISELGEPDPFNSTTCCGWTPTLVGKLD